MKTLLALLTLTAILGAADGAALYKKCAACHGANAEKAALGKSEKIGGWEAAKVAEALHAYKAGTRNTQGMGALMKGQVSTFSDADIDAVSAYIASKK